MAHSVGGFTHFQAGDLTNLANRYKKVLGGCTFPAIVF